MGHQTSSPADWESSFTQILHLIFPNFDPQQYHQFWGTKVDPSNIWPPNRKAPRKHSTKLILFGHPDLRKPPGAASPTSPSRASVVGHRCFPREPPPVSLEEIPSLGERQRLGPGLFLAIFFVQKPDLWLSNVENGFQPWMGIFCLWEQVLIGVLQWRLFHAFFFPGKARRRWICFYSDLLLRQVIIS